MWPMKSDFIGYQRLHKAIYVDGISNGLPAVGVGKVRIQDGNGHSRELEGVLHVPKLKNGLMSLTRANMTMGWKSVIEDGRCTISDGEFKIYADIVDGLCKWKSNGPTANSALAEVDLETWHKRLAHVSKGAIISLSKHVDGLHILCSPHDNNGKPCEPCIFGKHQRDPFHSNDKQCKQPGELVHSDLCGEFQEQSLGGGKYFVTFIDDATRHTRVYILANKKQKTVLKVFREHCAWAEKQSGYPIKLLRTDGGSEYRDQMKQFCLDLGIEHQPTAPYSPQSNGVAERMNRTLLDMVRPMILDSKLALSLWGEAVSTACYLRNRMST